MTSNHETFMEVQPFDAQRLSSAPLDALVDRLRSVRLKVGRWLPNADALAAWSVDYADVYRAATRLESAVRELDAHLACAAVDDVYADATEIDENGMTLQLLLCEVEASADAFEESVLESLGGHD